MGRRARGLLVGAMVGGILLWVLCVIAVPATVERQGLETCNNTAISEEGPYTPVEVVRLGWFWECTYEEGDWAFVAILVEIAVAGLFTWVLGSLAHDWDEHGPPHWAIEQIAFAGAAIVTAAGVGAAFLAGSSFAISNRTEHYPGAVTGGVYLAATVGALASFWLGAAAFRLIESRLQVRSAAATGLLVAGSTAVGIVIATTVALALAVAVLVFLAVYAAAMIIWFAAGATVIGLIAKAAD